MENHGIFPLPVSMESDRLLMMEKKNNCWLLFGNDSVLIHGKRQRFIENILGFVSDPVVFDGTGLTPTGWSRSGGSLYFQRHQRFS